MSSANALFNGSITTMTPSISNDQLAIFIADDSQIVQERLVTLLDELIGVEIVGQAESGANTIKAIRNLHPDAVILDIRMPDGSGLDVLAAIKQDEVTPFIIILTNYPYPGYREKCLRAGADYFLDKSTEFDQIPAIIAQFKQDLMTEQD